MCKKLFSKKFVLNLFYQIKMFHCKIYGNIKRRKKKQGERDGPLSQEEKNAARHDPPDWDRISRKRARALECVYLDDIDECVRVRQKVVEDAKRHVQRIVQSAG